MSREGNDVVCRWSGEVLEGRQVEEGCGAHKTGAGTQKHNKKVAQIQRSSLGRYRAVIRARVC